MITEVSLHHDDRKNINYLLIVDLRLRIDTLSPIN